MQQFLPLPTPTSHLLLHSHVEVMQLAIGVTIKEAQMDVGSFVKPRRHGTICEERTSRSALVLYDIEQRMRALVSPYDHEELAIHAGG